MSDGGTDKCLGEWCKEYRKRIDKRLDEITSPDGYLTKIHNRINGILWLIVAVGIVGVANLIAALY